jgi:DNA-binding response OmpR family regulator
MVYRVLIVDDEPMIVNLLQSYLRLRGFDVTGCADAESALQKMADESYHVALLDIKLPGMNGIELLKRVKEVSPVVQVIMMTAFSTVEIALKCLEGGASDYLLKPFGNLNEVATIVQSACERVGRWENLTHSRVR